METEGDTDFDYYLGIATSSYGDMLLDDERNKKFSLALKKAIDKVHARGEKAHVLDIGTGTGLLSMLAVSHGADTVVACEMFEPVAKCAARIIKANGFADQIKLVNKISLDLTVGESGDLPRKANILVSEVFDTELIGERAIATFNHAHSVLLEVNSIVIPSVGTVYGQIVESPLLLRWHRLEEWFDGDRSLLNVPSSVKTCAGTPALFDFQLSQLPTSEFVALTEPIPLFKFDFMRCKELPRLQYETFNVRVLANGKAHAVFTWWDLIMDDEGDILLSCAPVWHHPDGELFSCCPVIFNAHKLGPKILPDGNPALNIPWRDHWMQSAYFFRTEHEISQKTTLRAWHDEFSYWFALCICESNGRDGCVCPSEQLPACSCSLHMIASRTRIASMNCRKRRSQFLKLAQELVSKKRIFVVLGDFSLLGILLCKLGAKQVYMVTESTANLTQRVIEEFIETNHCNQAKLCSLPEVVEDLRQLVDRDAQVNTEIALVAEPFYQSSILPWDDAKFILAMRNFFSLTEGFLDMSQVLISPSSFEIQGCCVQFDDLWKISQPVGKCMGFDVGFFDKLVSGARSMALASPEAQPLWEYPCKALSDPMTVLRWSSEQLSKPIKQLTHFLAKKQANEEVNGIAFWVEYTMLPGIKMSTGPVQSPQVGKYIAWDRCERQGVHLYDVAPLTSNLPCQVKFEPELSEIFLSFQFFTRPY